MLCLQSLLPAKGIHLGQLGQKTIDFCAYPSAAEKEKIDILSIYILNSYINNNVIIIYYYIY